MNKISLMIHEIHNDKNSVPSNAKRKTAGNRLSNQSQQSFPQHSSITELKLFFTIWYEKIYWNTLHPTSTQHTTIRSGNYDHHKPNCCTLCPCMSIKYVSYTITINWINSHSFHRLQSMYMTQLPKSRHTAGDKSGLWVAPAHRQMSPAMRPDTKWARPHTPTIILIIYYYIDYLKSLCYNDTIIMILLNDRSLVPYYRGTWQTG